MNDIVTVSDDETSFSAHYFRQEDYMFESGWSNGTIAPPIKMPEGYKII
jgi:hypothetical protein